MKAELKEIERLTVNNSGAISLDTWGDSVRSMLYFWLINEFKEKGINHFTGDKGNYIVYFRNGSDSIGGMSMGSPDSMLIQMVNSYPKTY